MTDPKGGSLSVADATALKAELATMRENLTASTALNEARDIEMKALIAAKSAQDSSTSLAAKAQETKEVQLREQLTASTSKLETLVRDTIADSVFVNGSVKFDFKLLSRLLSVDFLNASGGDLL